MYMSGIVKSTELCFADSGAALTRLYEVPICLFSSFLPLSSGCTMHAISFIRCPAIKDPCFTGADIISAHGAVQTHILWKTRSFPANYEVPSAHSKKILSQNPSLHGEAFFRPRQQPQSQRYENGQTRRNAIFERGPGPGDPLVREDRGRRETRTGGGRR
jgi:hypothetical protein